MAPEAYLGEIGKCIEQVYLSRQAHHFLEDTPAAVRCAHLEALLDPLTGTADAANFGEFQQSCEAWQVDSERRAAIAAIDRVVMELRGNLLANGRKLVRQNSTALFPLERQFTEMYCVLGRPLGGLLYLVTKVKRELGRVARRVRGRLGLRSPLVGR